MIGAMIFDQPTPPSTAWRMDNGNRSLKMMAMELAAKEEHEIDYWRTSPMEHPESDSIDTVLSKMSARIRPRSAGALSKRSIFRY